MTTWLEANRLANLAAAQAHGDLAIETTVPPIDVYGAIGDAGVVLMWRTMPRQFGAYVNEPASRPGILVNNGLAHSAQRHTAAHELGHHRLRHASRADIDLDPIEVPRAGWSPEEMMAEAFASWFLMPRKAVAAALTWLGVEQPETAEDVYRLSLLLGTPYRSTARHLVNLRLAQHDRSRRWIATPPNKIKAKLDPAAAAPSTRRPDVWLINRGFAEMELTVHPGDRLVVPVPTNPESIITYPEGVTQLATSPGNSRSGNVMHPDEYLQIGQSETIVLEVQGMTGGRITVPGSADALTRPWGFDVAVEGPRSGVARRWIA